MPGSPAKQAPRVLTTMLVALEHMVVCVQTPRYYRVFSWWQLIQNWATLRFSDHRGILPSSVKIDVTGFSAQLTRSKTLGDDRTVASRPHVMDRCCYLAVAGWMQEGWRLLKDMADYPRDCLIPFPSSNGHGCRRRELSYDTASAMQNRVLRMVKSSDEFLFCPSATRFWTPHSNRTFMPSATETLGFEKSFRDFLGGSPAQASERYARIAARRIRNMQRTVVQNRTRTWSTQRQNGADGQTLSTSSATLRLESAFFLVPFLACRPLAAYAVRSGIMAYFTTFSDAAKAAVPQLEPTLEAALRKYDVDEDIITGFRCNRIKSQAVFVALDRTMDGLTDTLKEAFGVDPSKGFAHKHELAQLIAAWEESKVQCETKTKVDAVSRSHGEPTSHLPADWQSIMKGFKQKHGANIPEYYLPSQSYFEAFEEKVNEGRLRPETLAQVVSVEEEEAQERTKPEQTSSRSQSSGFSGCEGPPPRVSHGVHMVAGAGYGSSHRSSTSCPRAHGTTSLKSVARTLMKRRVIPLTGRSRTPRRSQTPLSFGQRRDGDGSARSLLSLPGESGLTDVSCELPLC